MRNVLHILAKKPALEKWDMYAELEDIAFQLVRTGKLRIDAEDKTNFVRFSRPELGANYMFSYRELYDPLLEKRTLQVISHAMARKYRGETLKRKTYEEFMRMKGEGQKNINISFETELKVARALVQATEPVVILLIIAEHVEIYVSFSHSVGDMMDIPLWQAAGDSSGLQHTYGNRSSVYISCGGNPFTDLADRWVDKETGPRKKKKQDKKPEDIMPPEYGDGFPALARMLVVGAQELGHFADIIRDSKGNKVSRHSSNGSITRPQEHTRQARLKDIAHVEALTTTLYSLGLDQALQAEKTLQFFLQHRKKRYLLNIQKQRAKSTYKRFIRRCRQKKLFFVGTIPQKGYPAFYTAMALSDTRMNLAPQAACYKHENPDVEEAIACAEALARVPQQAMKWEHPVTRALMPNLYAIYYQQVIPTCTQSYIALTGKTPPATRTRIKKPFSEKIKSLLRSIPKAF